MRTSMNQDHVTAGVGAGTATAALTTVLEHFQGVSADVAGSEALLMLMAAGAVYAALRPFVAHLMARFAPPVPPAA
jgi:hypothetical protein